MIYSWPPTPTPLPPGVARFTIGEGYSLWSGTDAAITMWNWAGDTGTVIQVIALIGIVLIGMTIIYKAFQKLTERDSQS